MFGLEKKEKEKFAFDLEADLAQHPEKTKMLLHKIQTRMEELKKLLRTGQSSDDFDQYGVLLHGYAALQRVLKKVAKAKAK
jgi:pyridoxal/pyridoxine/pyridoxamine kinase